MGDASRSVPRWRSQGSRRPRTRSTSRRHRIRASATSSTAPRRRSTSGSSPPARSRSRTSTRIVGGPAGGQGRATLNTTNGAIDVGASPFGAYWYPVKPFGDAVFRIQFTVQDTPTSTRNGGVMIRSPEIRYTCPDPANPTGPRIGCSTANSNAATLALKPTGFNFDVCPGAIPLCGRDTPAPSTTYTVERRLGPVPAGRQLRRRVLRAVLGRRGPHGRRPAADGAREQPAAVHDQRQRRQSPALDAGLLRSRDPDQRDADRQRPGRGWRRPDQDRLGLRLPQPQRAAVEDLRAPHQGRLARDGDPHHRPAVHGSGRRRDDQPVRQRDPEDRVACR